MSIWELETITTPPPNSIPIWVCLQAKPAMGEDATAVFNMLSGYSEPLVWNKLSLAPLWSRGKFLSLIEREKEHAKNGRPARIIAKMNSLCDPGIIEALYDARPRRAWKLI